MDIYFRALWLATQGRDTHWIFTGLQNTMDARYSLVCYILRQLKAR